MFILIPYLILIISFAFVWYKEKSVKTESIEVIETISVIIAFRNESKNLHNLINSLLGQEKVQNFEIIFVNDHSTDNSVEIIEMYKNHSFIKLLNLPENLQGKKQALLYASKQAKGNILFFTDADCVLPKFWLNTMYNYMSKKNLQMLCAAVEFIEEKGILNKIFQLEFLSMTGSGAAGFFLKKPFICNGANYAIKKEIFEEASKFFNLKYSSGDDVFLLHYVSKHYKVGFIKSEQTIVKTKAPQNIKQFFSQRIRWASKTSGYKNFMTIFSIIINFLYSFSLFFFLFLSIFNYKFLFVILTFFILKFFVDLIFMLAVLKFYKKQKLIIYFPIVQLFYPFYIISIGILSQTITPIWKERLIKY